jgi:hypothetical protein
MKTFFPAIALAAATISSVFAQPAVHYYNSVPSSLSPAIVSDPSPRRVMDGDYVTRDPDPMVLSELSRLPRDVPEDRR